MFWRTNPYFISSLKNEAYGNLTQDLNKEIINISYNELNLPEIIDFKYNNRILYQYDNIKMENKAAITWWKRKAIYFNSIIIGLIALVLTIEKVVFPFSIIGFIVPIIIVFLIGLNVVYFFILYLYLLFYSKKEVQIRYLRNIYLLFILVIVCFILYFSYKDITNLIESKKHNEYYNSEAKKYWCISGADQWVW